MRMRKAGALILAAALCVSIFPVSIPVYAYDFSDEAAWVNKCSAVQSSSQDSKACSEFKKYYKQQHHDEIYDALRSFIEEMLGHSIDLSDNRVLDYLDHADQAQGADPSSDGAGSACAASAVSAGSAQSQGVQDD